MSKFKVGDKVRVLANSVCILTGPGTVTKVEGQMVYVVNGTGERCWHHEDSEVFELIEKTLDNLEVGDKVERNGAERTVLAILPGLYGLSAWDETEWFGNWQTPAELKFNDYTVVQPESDTIEETVEVTLEEIAAFAGTSVDKLRIKE